MIVLYKVVHPFLLTVQFFPFRTLFSLGVVMSILDCKYLSRFTYMFYMHCKEPN